MNTRYPMDWRLKLALACSVAALVLLLLLIALPRLEAAPAEPQHPERSAAESQGWVCIVQTTVRHRGAIYAISLCDDGSLWVRRAGDALAWRVEPAGAAPAAGPVFAASDHHELLLAWTKQFPAMTAIQIGLAADGLTYTTEPMPYSDGYRLRGVRATTAGFELVYDYAGRTWWTMYDGGFDGRSYRLYLTFAPVVLAQRFLP